MRATTYGEIKSAVANAIANKKEDGGFTNVICVACGGTHGTFYPVEYFLRAESKKLAVYSLSAYEFLENVPACLGKNSLVLTGSLSGGTAAVLAAAELAKKAGAAVFGFSGAADTKLAKISDESFIFLPEEPENTVDQQVQYQCLAVAVELLQQTEGFAYYDKMLIGFERIVEITKNALKKIQPRKKKFGEQYKDEPLIYTVASGPSFYVAYMQSICMFMEMEWIHSSPINSGEFFHGPFEITDPDTPFMMIVSEGKTRKIDERALKFLKNYGEKIIVVDAKELGINTIEDEVVTYFNPLLLYPVVLDYTHGLAAEKKHPLLMRRYMGKVEY